MANELRPHTKDEALAAGFEAHCELLSGTRYLWHATEGIRVDPCGGVRWICDPADLPEGDWYPTEYGELEIANGDSP